MRRYSFYFAVGLLTFGIGIAHILVKIPRTVPNHDEIQIVEQKIVGFDEVIYGRNGEPMTVFGFIDSKYVCTDVTEAQQEICTTALVGNQFKEKFMQLRLKVCSENNKTNCIEAAPNAPRAGRGYPYIYDDEGIQIDFEGCEVIEESNEWYCKGEQLKFTGKVSLIDGKDRGRFINPIERIERIKTDIEIEYVSSLMGVESLDAIFKITNYTNESIYYPGYEKTHNQRSWVKQRGKTKLADTSNTELVVERELKPYHSTWFWIPAPQNEKPFEAGFELQVGNSRKKRVIWVNVRKQRKSYT